MDQIAKKQFEILQKNFITKADLKILIGETDSEKGKISYGQKMVDSIFHDIRADYTKELKEKGKIAPSRYVIPLSKTMKYIADYGITRKKIIDNYALILSMERGKDETR